MLHQLFAGEGQRPLHPRAVHNHDSHRVFGEGLLALLRLLQQNGFCRPIKPAVIQAVFHAEKMGDRLVKVISAQGIVTAHCQNVHHVVKAFHHGNIQCAASEVKHQKAGLALIRLITGKCRRAGLVHKPLHPKTGQLPRPLGGRPLPVVKICRHADHGLFHRFPQKRLGVLLQLAQHQSAQLLRGKGTARQRIGLVRPHRPLEGGRTAFRVAHQPLPCCLPHQNRTVLVDAYGTGRQHVPQRIGNQSASALLPYGSQAVGCSQVNANHGHRPRTSFSVPEKVRALMRRARPEGRRTR